MEHSGEQPNSQASIFIDPNDRSIEVMYKLELTEQQMRMHVTGLDSSVRVITSQITQHQSPGLALKQLLPELVNINKEFDFLQAALDAKIGASSSDAQVVTSVTS